MSKWIDNVAEHAAVLELSKKYLDEPLLKAAYACGVALKKGKKILICGNGGSAADAQHFAAELMVRFEKERRPAPALALTTDASVLTAIGNDYDFTVCFRNQLFALMNPGDIFLAISTSGDSPNIFKAAHWAYNTKHTVIGLTGSSGGLLKTCSSILLDVPSTHTARIQEIHSIILHTLAGIIEDSLS